MNLPKYTSENLDILKEFKLPITYIKNVSTLDEQIVSTLELETSNTENAEAGTPFTTSIYGNIFNSTSLSGHKMAGEMARYYTTDVEYLKNTQRILQHKLPVYDDASNDICYNLWRTMKEETAFHANYNFISWEQLRSANTHPLIMQILCTNDLFTPSLTILSPFFAAFVPYIIGVLVGAIKFSLESYTDYILSFLSGTSIGKLLTSFNSLSNNEKIWCTISIIAFLVSSIQGLLGSKRTVKNLQSVQEQLWIFKNHISQTIQSMCLTRDTLLQIGATESSHKKFSELLNTRLSVLNKMHDELNTPDLCLDNRNFYTSRMFLSTGKLMSIFYKMYDNTEYHDALLYSFGYNAYTANLQKFQCKIIKKELNMAVFKRKTRPPGFKMKNATYPVTRDAVPNNLSMSRVSIITGPNASGKTTVLKTVFINLLLAQQYGYGYFTALKFMPYDVLYCYLNIPDTSGRDSLFQAEARRCKTIINNVRAKHSQNHFAIFDEIFSGTNPEEAEKCAGATLKYLAKEPNITALITTHYTSMCGTLNRVNGITNYNMKKYNLSSGISNVNGGCKILQQLGFPQEILTHLNDGA